MKLIALSGGIASGKSTIARRLVELGASHIDADQLAREAVAPKSRGLQQIAERYGGAVIDEHGALDRAALGTLVFQDQDALEDLNAIVHPEVRRLAQERLDAIAANDAHAIVIYDVPLLVEANVSMPWDLVVIAHASKDTRKQRLVELRAMSPEEAEQRIASQATDAQRLQAADVVIDTEGSMQHTLEQTDELWKKLVAQNSD